MSGAVTGLEAAEAPAFPPLIRGVPAPAGADPVAAACAQAMLGCDGGLLVYAPGPEALRAALVLAPEVPLERACIMLPLAQCGLQNALGALAPPEVAVEFDWEGRIYVNGARCGAFRLCLPEGAVPGAVPDWLVVGFTLPLMAGPNPGERPEETALYEEGCAEIAPARLLEAWARHSLAWLHRWEEGESAALHREWRGLLKGLGEDVEVRGHTGLALGLDEDFGLLLRQGSETRALPLHTLGDAA